jgi:biopolymer transport protein ExbD
MSMFDLGPTGDRRRLEPVLPMVNLVFLLLIFFLLAAVIAPRPPEPVDPPRAAAPQRLEPASLRVSLGPDGTLAYGALRGPAALAALAAELAAAPDQGIALHADRRAPAARAAAVLSDLSRPGRGPVWLVAEPTE